MRATVIQKRGVTIVSFEGQLDFSHPEQIRNQLKWIYSKKQNKRIMLNLSALQFIGSSGIKPFIEMLKDFNKPNSAPRYYGLAPEFKRLFDTYQGRKKFKIFPDQKEALKSYRFYKKSGHA